ncbi:MAG: hypothetical protein NT047_02530 [Deltaproteobacteria bacterium]|nr:hypothetical protein [Deltaproteobacteria bacterium]
MNRRQINEEELQALFAAIGKGIWYLQYVEDVLHNYITLKRDVKVRGTVSPEKAEAILLKNRSKTLGKSLQIASDAQVLSPSLQKRLNKFKDERDWLVHRSVYQNGDDLYLEVKRVALINRIQIFSDEALLLQKLIAKEMEDFVVPQRVSREQIMHMANENMRKLKGE